MSELDLLIKDIEKMRKILDELIEAKQENLQDPEVLAASCMLNATITKYNEIIYKKLSDKEK